MNSLIDNLDFNKVLGVDIETCRGVKDIKKHPELLEKWKWKCRDRENNKLPTDKDAIEAYNNKAALYAEWGKIICISMGYVSKGVISTKSFTGEEEDIVNSFVEMITGSGRIIAVHNAGFDIPYIQKRHMILNKGKKAFPSQYNSSGIKPWEKDSFCIDTMDVWKCIGFQNTSLDELSMCMGIPSPKGDIKGSDVSRVYWDEGGVKRISEYCERDVATVLNIINVWKGDDVMKHDAKEGEVKFEGNILQKIMESGAITEDDIEYLTETMKGSSSKDLQTACDIVKAHYLRPKAKKADNQARAEEVELLFQRIAEMK